MTYKTETIKNAVMSISHNKYLLPAIQRELVWDHKQIETLFDSILSGYPFGAMLFWRYKKDENNKDYKFYDFLRAYDEFDHSRNHNAEHNTTVREEITGILDGQQRLTALFLGLKGYMNLHKRGTWRNLAGNYEKKFLFINLLYNKDSETEDEDIKPEFQLKFKTEDQAQKESLSPDVYWFKIGNALDWKEKKDWKDVLVGRELSENQRDVIEDVCSAIYEKLINSNNPRISYYEEDTDSLDKVLNIFVRVNSGGTALDYTDFLMSMIINQWGDGKISMLLDEIVGSAAAAADSDDLDGVLLTFFFFLGVGFAVVLLPAAVLGVFSSSIVFIGVLFIPSSMDSSLDSTEATEAAEVIASVFSLCSLYRFRNEAFNIPPPELVFSSLSEMLLILIADGCLSITNSGACSSKDSLLTRFVSLSISGSLPPPTTTLLFFPPLLLLLLAQVAV